MILKLGQFQVIFSQKIDSKLQNFNFALRMASVHSRAPFPMMLAITTVQFTQNPNHHLLPKYSLTLLTL